MLNDCFSQQCTTAVNNSSSPTNPTFQAENRLFTLEFSIVNVIKIIRSLGPNKAHGDGEISIRIIRIYAKSRK